MTASVAGPILAFETSRGVPASRASIIVNLLVIVAAPWPAGVPVWFSDALPGRGETIAATTSALAVAALVGLGLAAEVHLSTASTAPSSSPSCRSSSSPSLVGLLIATRPRAAGHESHAAHHIHAGFHDRRRPRRRRLRVRGGHSAAAIYGIPVLLWGTGSAGFMRARHAEPAQ